MLGWSPRNGSGSLPPQSTIMEGKAVASERRHVLKTWFRVKPNGGRVLYLPRIIWWYISVGRSLDWRSRCQWFNSIYHRKIIIGDIAQPVKSSRLTSWVCRGFKSLYPHDNLNNLTWMSGLVTWLIFKVHMNNVGSNPTVKTKVIGWKCGFKSHLTDKFI